VPKIAVFIGRSPDTASLEDIRRFQLQVAASGVGARAINRNLVFVGMHGEKNIGRIS
jgi:hypothetical protein